MDGEEVPGSLQEEYHEEPAIVVNPPFLHEIGSSGVDHDCSPKKKKGYTLSETFQQEVVRVLQENDATFQNKLTAVAVAQKYAALYQKSIKEGMKLRDKSIKWWQVLKEIRGVSVYISKDKNPEDSSYVKLYLKDSSPPDLETINERILGILQDYANGLNGIEAGMIINKYIKRYGTLVSTDLAVHTNTKFTKYIALLPGVVKTYEGKQPTFSFMADVESFQASSSSFSKVKEPGLGNDIFGENDFVDVNDYPDDEMHVDAQFSPQSSPIISTEAMSSTIADDPNSIFEDGGFDPDILDMDGELATLEKPHVLTDESVTQRLEEETVDNVVHSTTAEAQEQTQEQIFQQQLDTIISKLLFDKGDLSARQELRSFIVNNIANFNDQHILAVFGSADVPDENGKVSLMLISDLVDIGLVAQHMQTIKDPFTNEVAWEFFVNLKKFQANQQVILKGLNGRLKTSLRSRTREANPVANSTVVLPLNVKPYDATDQWLGTSTLVEVFTRIRNFSYNGDLVAIIGTLARKIHETLQIFPKPILLRSTEPSSLTEATATYIYKLHDISYFSMQQFARVIHSFRSYEQYHEDIARALYYINEKTNLMKCMEKSDKIVVEISDLKYITKGIIKLMQDATRTAVSHDLELPDDPTETGSSVVKRKMDPLYNICQFVASKISCFPKTTKVDEDLIVNILQSIKGHGIEDVRIRMIMSAIAKYGEQITHHDLKDERIVETLLQFTALTVGKYHHKYTEVEEMLLLLGKMLNLSYEKFVKSKFMAPGAAHPDAIKLDQLSKNILQRSKRYGFESSELRYSMRNLTSSSQAVRYFFSAIQPWINFVFSGNDFDQPENVKKIVTIDQVTKSYLGLSKLREDVAIENLRSIFNLQKFNVALTKPEIEDIVFAFEQIVSRVITVPFEQLFQPEYSEDGSSYSTDFLSNAIFEDEHLVTFGKLLNPRMKYNFLKMIGKCCSYWPENDIVYSFVTNQLLQSLNVDIDVDIADVKRVRETKKRKRDNTDEDATVTSASVASTTSGSTNNTANDFPFFSVWVLYCELLYHLGKEKSWRGPSARKLLIVIFSKLKQLLPYVQDDLFTTVSNDPPIEKRCTLFLKNLSILTLALEGVAIIDYAFLDIFQFIKKIFTTVYYDVMATITKNSALNALHSNNNIIRGLSRMMSLRNGQDISTMTMVIHKQLSLLQMIQEDSTSSTENGQNDSTIIDVEHATSSHSNLSRQESFLHYMAKCCRSDGFLKLLSGPKSLYQLDSHEIFPYYVKNFEENFDKPLLDLAKSKDSFSYFDPLSAVYRSFSVFFLLINFTEDEYQEDYSHFQHSANLQNNEQDLNVRKKRSPFDLVALTNIIKLFCEKVYLAMESFQQMGIFPETILNLLSSSPVRSSADYHRLKASLKTWRLDDHSPNKEDLQTENRKDPQTKALLSKCGDHAVNVLYNMRHFVHLFIEIHQSPLCCEITRDCADYVNFISDLNRMIGVQLLMVIIDFEELSVKSLVKLLRICMSLLEYNAAMDGLPREKEMRFSRMDLLPFLLESSFQRSVKLLEALYTQQTLNVTSSGSNLPNQNNSLSSLLSKDNVELFQECYYFIQFYYGIFPFSCRLQSDFEKDGNPYGNIAALRDNLKIEIESLKLIYDNVYDGIFQQLPGDRSCQSTRPSGGSTISTSRNSANDGSMVIRMRCDDLNCKSVPWYRDLERECIEITKGLLSETNRMAWNSMIPYGIVSSFPSLMRFEYSPSTILSFANMYVHASSYFKVENGTNCITIYHERFGRVMIFSHDLQFVPQDSNRFLEESGVKSKEDFHHHLLVDMVLDSDFVADGTFNIICNSSKMAKGFNVIYTLIVVNVDDSTSKMEECNLDVHRSALEELMRLLLQYVGLMF